MLILQDISYSHPNKDELFNGISLTVNRHDKIALIGNNGSGKSTLLKLITRELFPSGGKIINDNSYWFVPQVYGQFDHLTIAQALGIEKRLAALHGILKGDTSEYNFNTLNEDWTIEDRCKEAFGYWRLNNISLSQKMESLSGGQKTKVFLAGIFIHQPDLLLLDEPSNHLDIESRHLLYDFIQSTKITLLAVSHDKKLLNLLDTVCEIDKRSIKTYGGNYAFYVQQKEIEKKSLELHIEEKEKSLRKAKDKERETIERQQRLDNRGKAKQEKAGIAKIMMNTLRNKAENSTSKLKTIHAEKIEGIVDELQDLRASASAIDKMKFNFDDSHLHKGKILIRANDINVIYGTKHVWTNPLSLEILSSERIALTGSNGSGKTTLLKIISGIIKPGSGTVYRAAGETLYIDQDYSLLNNKLTVYEQAQFFNKSAFQEHEIKTRLNRFLFTKNDWDKNCAVLSGGERMRLVLCSLMIANKSPDIIILDEPTNNIDIQNLEILIAAINSYTGTLIVVSHDEQFLEDIGITRRLKLNK